MKLSGVKFCVWMLLVLGLFLGTGQPVRAQQDEIPEEFPIRLENGERRLDGTIRSVNFNRGLFVLDATSMTWPSGLAKPLEVPVPMLVTISDKTFFHVRRSDSKAVNISQIDIGDSAVVVGVYSTATQRWSAVEVAVWSRKEKGVFVLNGYSPKVAPIAKLNGDEQCYPIPTGFVTSWKGDKAALDSTGNHPGVLQSGTVYEPSMVGSGFSFDGEDDRVTVPDSSDFAFTGSFTLEGWLYIKSSKKSGIIFLRGDNRPGLDPIQLMLKPNGIFNYRICSATDEVALETTLPLETWIHFATTLDAVSGQMQIYVNGEPVSQVRTKVRPLVDLIESQGAAVGIGNAPSTGNAAYNFPFHGVIDELSLYKRALTGDEIRGIFLAGDAGKCPPAPILAPKASPFTKDASPTASEMGNRLPPPAF